MNFKDIFMDLDAKIMDKLGDTVDVTPSAAQTVSISAVLRTDVDDEEVLERYEDEVATLEILESDLTLFADDTVVQFEGLEYEYLTDYPKGVGRYLIVLREVI